MGTAESMQGTDKSSSGDDSGSRIGLPVATALIMGSVIGTGIFALPQSLAPYGPISIVAFLLASIGALVLADVAFGLILDRKSVV